MTHENIHFYFTSDTFPPTLSCNYILIEGNGNSLDGTYIRNADNLYQQKRSDTIDYYFQFALQGEYYIIQTSDMRESCVDEPEYYLRTDDRSIDNLQHGDSITVPLVYPEDGSATITCLEDVLPSPHEIRRVAIPGSVIDWDGSIVPNSGYEEVNDEIEQSEIEDNLDTIKSELSLLFNFDYVYTVFLDVAGDQSSLPPWMRSDPEPAVYCKDEVDGSVSCKCKVRYHGPPPPPIEVC